MPLKIVKRPKSPNWYIRGTVAGTYVEESSGTSDRTRAEYLRARRESELLDQAVYGAKKTATFVEAVEAYILAGGERRFLLPLVDHFGVKPLSTITQASVDHAAQVLYPRCSSATRVRQVYVPMTSIINRAAKAGLCDPVRFERPKVTRKPVSVPPDKWWAAIEAQASPNLWALLVFLANTGTRVSEALRLKWEDVDIGLGTAMLRRTKGGKPRLVNLNAAVIASLRAKRAWEDIDARWKTDQVFNFQSRANVYRSLRGACERAGVPYYPTHSAGRHTFASRGLKAGWSLKLLQEAGGWSSIKMPAENYGHMEASQVREAVMKLGENPGTKRRRSK